MMPAYLLKRRIKVSDDKIIDFKKHFWDPSVELMHHKHSFTTIIFAPCRLQKKSIRSFKLCTGADLKKGFGDTEHDKRY